MTTKSVQPICSRCAEPLVKLPKDGLCVWCREEGEIARKLEAAHQSKPDRRERRREAVSGR